MRGLAVRVLGLLLLFCDGVEVVVGGVAVVEVIVVVLEFLEVVGFELEVVAVAMLVVVVGLVVVCLLVDMPEASGAFSNEKGSLKRGCMSRMSK